MEEKLENQGEKKTFKSLMTQFADKTSISGVPHIQNTKSAAGKALWTLLLICSLGAMFFHLYYLFNSFLLWPKKTTLSLGFSNLYLPAITICNANPVKKSHLQYTSTELQNIAHAADPNFSSGFDHFDYLDLTVFEDEEYAYFDHYYQSGDGFYTYDYTTYDYYPDFIGTEDKLESLLERFRDEYMEESSDTRRSIGHTIDDMLVRCRFGKYRCFAENFTEFQSKQYGNCYKLESKKFRITRPGSESGLAIILFLQNHQYLPGITDGYGVRVQVHAPETIPFPYESGFYVQAGQETSISLKQTVIERIDKPYGDCASSDQFSKLYHKLYTRQACQFLCKATKIMEMCGCYNEDDQELLQNTDIDYKACTKKSEIGCIVKTTKAIDAKKLKCDCPDPCSETSYTMNLASRQWPTLEFASILVEAVCKNSTDDCAELKLLGSDPDKDALRRQFLKLVIYYEELNFAEIKEEPDIENVQFASDFGGAVGLWIGLSVLSFFEVFQLIAEIVQFLLYKFGIISRKENDINTNKRQDNAHYKENYGYDVYSDNSKYYMPPVYGYKRSQNLSPISRNVSEDHWSRSSDAHLNSIYGFGQKREYNSGKHESRIYRIYTGERI